MIGHEHLASDIAALDSPILVVGPRSVGKATVLREVLPDAYVMNAPLDITSAERIESIAVAWPFIIIDLDGATHHALAKLRTLLDDGPPLYMHSTVLPPAEISSQCTVLHAGYLRDDEVAQVLMQGGETEEVARAWAHGSGGTIEGAYHKRDADTDKAPLISLFAALAQHSYQIFSFGLERVGDRQVELLRTWAFEAASGQWNFFTPDDDYGLHKNPQAVKFISDTLDSPARSRIVVRSALLPFFSRAA